MVMVSKLNQVHSTLFQYKGVSVFRVSSSQTKKLKVLMSSELSEACLARESSHFYLDCSPKSIDALSQRVIKIQMAEDLAFSWRPQGLAALCRNEDV